MQKKNEKEKRRSKERCLFVAFGIVSLAQQIIYGNVVKICQSDQDICGNITLPQFIIAIDLLGTVEKFGNLPLLQVTIFPQIPNPLVHSITSGLGYHTAFCCIDKYRKMR